MLPALILNSYRFASANLGVSGSAGGPPKISDALNRFIEQLVDVHREPNPGVRVIKSVISQWVASK